MNRKELLLLSIGVFLTVIAWLVADIIHASSQEKVKVNMEIPTLKKYQINKNLLNTLKNKVD